MKIDYSTPQSSKPIHYLSRPFIYGGRHIGLGVSKEINLDLVSRILHVVFGILQLIPFIGMFVASADSLINNKSQNKVFYIKAGTPYERGKQFGMQLRKKTQDLYKIVLSKITLDSYFIKQREELVKYIPDHMKEEMKGLADGANVSFEDVVNVHTFLDIYAGKYGCSVLASYCQDGKIQRLVATNHFQNEKALDLNSTEREKILLSSELKLSSASHKAAIQKTNKDDTIQSIVFDPNQGSLDLTSGWNSAANNDGWKRYFFFPPQNISSSFKLTRNLDWPLKILGSQTIAVCTDPKNNQPQFVNITFPGYLGVLSGMNNKGVALACSQSGGSRQEGIPDTLLFRQIISKAATTKAALEMLKQHIPASCMNLVIAGPDGIAKVELDPNRKQKGYASIKKAS